MLGAGLGASYRHVEWKSLIQGEETKLIVGPSRKAYWVTMGISLAIIALVWGLIALNIRLEILLAIFLFPFPILNVAVGETQGTLFVVPDCDRIDPGEGCGSWSSTAC